MKLSSQEEYGIRCLLHLARGGEGASLTIPEISRAEGLSVPNVAKLMRILRIGGFVKSVRGQAGGYTLAYPARDIKVAQVLEKLGGNFFGPKFCDRHTGSMDTCMHSVDCSLRALWTAMENALQAVLGNTTLQDLMVPECEMVQVLNVKAIGGAAGVSAVAPIVSHR
jgi:Rrf2 family protein